MHISIFGVPGIISSEGQTVALRTRKQIGLVLYLALEGRDRPMSRDALVELFWSDVPAVRGRHSLAQAITEIRKRLGGEAAVSQNGVISLTGPVTTDLDRLREDPRGIDLANPLADADGWAGIEYAHWIEVTRSRCLKAAREALIAGIRDHRLHGRTELVFASAEALHALDPLSDVAVEALVERAMVEGDVVGGIRLLREHIRLNEEEFGCGPRPGIIRILRRLESGFHGGYPAARSAMTAHTQVLVGRSTELALLERQWQEAAAGATTTCLVVGPPGIGKSSLLRQFASSIEARGSTLIRLACHEVARTIPYSACRDLVTTLLDYSAVGETDPLWLSEVARVCPAVRERYPGVPEPLSTLSEAFRLRLAEAVYRIVEAVTEGAPLAVVIDDIHNMDPPSQEIFYLLVRRLSGSPLLVLAAERRMPPLPSDLGGSSRKLEWANALELGPLSPEHARFLVVTRSEASGLTDEDARGRIEALAAGNPYFLEILLSDWELYSTASLAAAGLPPCDPDSQWEPPPSMRAAYARLYQQLSPEAQSVMDILSVAQRGLPPSAVGRALGLDRPTLDQAVLSLIDRGIVRIEEQNLCFKNDLHRSFVYFTMSPDARKFHHARLGELIGDSESTPAFQQNLEAGHHYLAGGEPEAGAQGILSGAKSAIQSAAPQEAEQTLRRLLEQSSEPGVHRHARLLLADALVSQGKLQEALAILEESIPDDVSHTQRAYAAVLRSEGLHRLHLYDNEVVVHAAEEALKLAGLTGDNGLLMRAIQVSAEVASESGMTEIVDKAGSTALRIALENDLSTEARARALLTQAYCELVGGEFQLAAATFRASSKLFSDLKFAPEHARTLHGMSMCDMSLGLYEEAIEKSTEFRILAERLGDIPQCANAWNHLGVAHEETGSFDVAHECYDRAIALLESTDSPRRLAEVCLNMADLAIINADYDEARHYLTRAANAAKTGQLSMHGARVMLAEADFHLAVSQPEDAWPLVVQATSILGGRSRAFDGIGRIDRLRLYYTYVTHGAAAMKRMVANRDLESDRYRLADRLEVLAFLDWIGPADKDYSDILQRILGTGVIGVIARLAAVGVYPPKVVRNQGESSAQLVQRLFPQAAPNREKHPSVYRE